MDPLAPRRDPSPEPDPRAQPPIQPGVPPGGVSPGGVPPGSATPPHAAAAAPPSGAARQPAEATITDADVPERPQLAPNVELSGKMEDSAFEQEQWLALRDGRFVQLTELLYRVAEQADGRRTYDEMAQAVSAVINRRVSAENIRQLLREKLIPLGLVIKADGTAVEPAGGADGGASARSPLQVNMRMAMIPAGLIEVPASVFQVLFWPPIFFGVIAIGLLAMAWLFFIHGLAQSFGGALNEPWLILVLLPVIVASAFYHEFGHAAALKYGGGKVRGMGAGFYLMYPAFYTDVTDNYRLSRWSKVRTDTGGFYFHLIFGLAVMALYLVTRQEFLLLAVFFIVLQIVHQSLPFVRLDGYWTLADLTGMPDLFSQMGPFLRSLLPIPGWRGRKLPPIKLWVKLVFILYILITIPLLLFLAFLMITRAPSVLATAWVSFFEQSARLGEAAGSGDWLTAVGSGLGMLVLLLTTAGFAFFMFKLAKGVVGRIWGWGEGSALKRAGSVALLGGIAVLLLFLWAPPGPLTGERGGLLYGSLSPFEPIKPDDRWTVQESFGGSAPEDFIAPPVPYDGTVDEAAPDATPAPSGEAQPTPDEGSGTDSTADPDETTAEPDASPSPTPDETLAP